MSKYLFHRPIVPEFNLGIHHTFCLSLILFLLFQNDLVSAPPSFEESASKPGNPGLCQEDLPGADFKVAESVFLIDDIRTT